MKSEICCVFNLAPHYRKPIYSLMDKELNCDFYFGDTLGNKIKLMDLESLKGFKRVLKNSFLGFNGFMWQKGAWQLIFAPYKHYIVTGSPAILSNWLIVILGRLMGKKVYAWSHGMKKPANTKGEYFQKTFYKLFNVVFLYGNFSKDIMLKEGFSEKKLVTIYNSLNHEEQIIIRQELTKNNVFKIHFKNENPVIIYVGRIQKSKRLDLLVIALKELILKGTSCNLVFVGADVEDNEIKDLVKSMSLSQNVWFYGPSYDETEIGNLFYNADVCVSPGPIGLTALHALTFGCPIISNDDISNQMPEHEAILPNKNGAFFINNDIVDLVTKISDWIDLDDKIREGTRNNCYRVVDDIWNPKNQLQIIKKTMNSKI